MGKDNEPNHTNAALKEIAEQKKLATLEEVKNEYQ